MRGLHGGHPRNCGKPWCFDDGLFTGPFSGSFLCGWVFGWSWLRCAIYELPDKPLTTFYGTLRLPDVVYDVV